MFVFSLYNLKTHKTISLHRNRLFIALCMQVLLPLILGLSIYLFLRPGQTIAENFICWNYEANYSFLSTSLTKIVTGSLPDFLWLYSMLNLLSLIWVPYIIPPQIKFAFYFLPIVTELLQHYHLIFGTADYLDVIAYLIAIYFHYSQNKKK